VVKTEKGEKLEIDGLHNYQDDFEIDDNIIVASSTIDGIPEKAYPLIKC